MTATPEKRARLVELYNRWLGGKADGTHVADFLLANGVDVTLPEQPDPDPWPVPGSVAIATVRGVEGQVVWCVATGQGGRLRAWVSPTSVEGHRLHPTGEVTVTSRAVVVTEQDRDELLEQLADADVQPGWVARTVREWFAARLEGGTS